jgi:hypothetical protein
MKEILPCPFCGGQPETKTHYEIEISRTEFASVRCKGLKCHVRPQVGSTTAKGKALESAIRRWNIRG